MKKLYEIYRQSSGVSIDSRTVSKDEVFFALKGPNFDGHKYVEEVLNQGASAAIIDNEAYALNDSCFLVEDTLTALQSLALYHRKKRFKDLTVIGLTGSNGKTTTKELLYITLQTKHKIEATIGNLNNHIGVPLTILRTSDSTDILIVEMGANKAGDIKELCEIACPNMGFVTNVSGAHLEGFGNVETIRKTKGELYNYLQDHQGKLFINVAEESLHPYLECYSDLIETHHLLNHKMEKGRLMVACLEEGKTPVYLKTHLTGAYNLQNIKYCLLVGNYFDISNNDILKAISKYLPSNNRSQIIDLENGATIVLDAYNANPKSVKLALDNIMQFDHSNKVAFLGDMLELGTDSVDLHTDTLDYARRIGMNEIICFGPEFEGISKKCGVKSFQDMAKMKLYFDSLSSHPNSVILIKGSRGMAMERLLD